MQSSHDIHGIAIGAIAGAKDACAAYSEATGGGTASNTTSSSSSSGPSYTIVSSTMGKSPVGGLHISRNTNGKLRAWRIFCAEHHQP